MLTLYLKDYLMHFDSGFLWLHPIYNDASDVKWTAPTLNNRESVDGLKSKGILCNVKAKIGHKLSNNVKRENVKVIKCGNIKVRMFWGGKCFDKL